MHEYDERSSRFSKQERESEQIARRENRMSGHQVEAVYTGFSNLPLDVQSRRDDRILARILDDDEFEDEEFEDTQTVESAFVQSEIVASNYLDAGWGEITNTENISEEQIEAEREIANEVLAGALKGDFNSDPTFWSDISQIVTGLIPIAGQLGDIRDLVHILDDITNKEGYKKIGSWAILVLIAIGFIPGIGDGIKSIGRRGIRYLDNNRILKKIGEFLGENIIAPILNRVGDLTAPIVDQIKNAIRRKLTEAQEIARQLGEGADNVTGRPQVATEGVGNVSPSRIDNTNQPRQNEPSKMSTNSPGSGGFEAYNTAKNGGKHSGFYRNYVGKPTEQIQKGIKKIQRQIEEHQNLIRDPKKYLSEYGKGDWDTLDPRQQKALVTKKWPSDIQRQREQQNILKGILEERQ